MAKEKDIRQTVMDLQKQIESLTNQMDGLKQHFMWESVDKAAKRLGVAKSTIYDWRKEGKIESKTIGKRILVIIS